MIKQLLDDRINKYIKDNNIRVKDSTTHFEYFVANVLLKNYDYSFNDLITGQVDGGGDEGIDSIYVIIDNKVFSEIDVDYQELQNIMNKRSEIIIIIIQSKTSTGFGEIPITAMKRGIECIIDSDTNLSNEKFKTQALLFRNVWRAHNVSGCDSKIKVNLYYASKSKNKEVAISNNRVVKEKDKLKKFVNDHDFECKYEFLGCNELITLDKEPIEYRKSLKILKKFAYPKKEDSILDGYMCLVNVKDYFEFICDDSGKIEDQYFEENIRDYQGTDEVVNNNIIKTIKGSYSDKFWCFNNGITMLAYNIKPFEDKLTMSNFQIINGCQTSYSIFEAFNNMTEEEIEKLDFELIIKIIQIKEDEDGGWNEDLVLKIIESTNAQTKIDSFAFESHKPVHKRIEEVFLLKEEPLYYERKPKYYERRGIAKINILNPFELFKVSYSVLFKKPSQTRNNPTELFKKHNSKLFAGNNNLEWFWIVYSLFINTNLELMVMSKSQKYNDDKTINFIFKNGSLHITRVMFSLINKSEFNPTYLTSNNIGKVIGKDVYNDYLSKNYEINKNVDIAIHIIKSSILEEKNGSNSSLEKIFKTIKLDERITKNVINYLQKNPKAEKSEVKDKNINIINNYKRILTHYYNIFSAISSNGDFRYNFNGRLKDCIYFINNYMNYLDINAVDLIDVLSNISDSVNESRRESRVDNAKEICRTLKSIEYRMRVEL